MKPPDIPSTESERHPMIDPDSAKQFDEKSGIGGTNWSGHNLVQESILIASCDRLATTPTLDEDSEQLKLSALLALSGSSVAQSPTPTPEPDYSLLGWYLGVTTERLTATSPWVTSGTYATECSTTDINKCAFPTECSQNTLTYDNGDILDCGSDYSCVTFTIFQTSPAGLPSASSVGCWMNWSAWTIYRKLPTSTTSSETPTTTDTPTTTTPPPTDTETESSTSATPAPTDTSPNSDDSSGSNAWIAGAVVGPVAGIAIIGLAAFFYYRRRNKPDTDAAFAPVAQNPQDGSYYGPAKLPQTSELDGSQYAGYVQPVHQTTLSEMPATTQTYELPTTRD